MHLPRKTLLFAALFAVAGAYPSHADEALRKAQQALRDQGFYYGTVDGSPGDETTQALKRYQIRNGLAVTGQLNDETQKSIAKTGAASAPAPRVAPKNDDDRRYANGSAPDQQPPIPPPLQRPPPVINGNDDDRRIPAPPPPTRQAAPPEPAELPPARIVRPSAGLTSMMQGSPYEFAPPPVQADVLRRAQSRLSHSGFYGGEANGVPDGLTADAISEFQSAYGLHRTGRLDVNTLAALHLLPGRRPAVDGPPPVYEGRIVR